MKNLSIITLLLVCASSASVYAADIKTPDKTDTTEIPEATTTTQKDSTGIEAALALFQTMNMEVIYNTTLEKTLRASIQQNPAMAAKADQLLALYQKRMGWNNMRDGIAKNYATTFTVAELKKITAFYQTPVGKKLAASQAQLTELSQKISAEISQALMPEVMKILQGQLQGQ